jgi:hypothetical protein
MGKTAAVNAAVGENRIVVACAYQGHVAEEVQAALPPGFGHARYVAKFLNGELVALEPGNPETAIQRLLGAEPAEVSESCKDGTCDKPAAPSPARP